MKTPSFLTIITFPIPLLAASGSLFAAQDTECARPSNVHCEECFNAPGRPELDCSLNVFASVEGLWWSAYQSGLDYIVETKTDPGFVPYLNNAKVHGTNNSYDLGFRFGVGYHTPFDGWDILGNWTFFNNEWESTAHDPKFGTLYPTFKNPDTSLSPQGVWIDRANAHWKFELNIIDLALMRPFFVSHKLILTPHFGLRYARLDQNWHVTYNALYQASRYDDAIHDSNDFWGFGLKGGLDTEWEMGCGFSIYGKGSAALLHGHFHISQQEYFFNKDTREKQNRLKLNHRFRAGRAATDLALGLKWDHQFQGERFHLSCHAGWEHHMFFGQNQLWQFVNGTAGSEATHSRSNDELSLQGWTFGGRLDF